MKRTYFYLGLFLLGVLAGLPLWYAFFPAAPLELPAAGHRVKIASGMSVNVIEAGSGPPVLLVHGHPGCAYDWAQTIRELSARGFRVLAYDRLGYGRSDGRPPGRVTVDTNAEELLQLLAALDLREVTLVGWSYGGGIAIDAVKRDSSRIARLALIASIGPDNNRADTAFERAKDAVIGAALSWAGRVPPAGKSFRAVASARAFHPSKVPQWYRHQLDANFSGAYTFAAYMAEARTLGREGDLDPSPIRLPILIMHGDEDQLVPLLVGEGLHARALQAEFQVIPEAGHMLPITHAPLLAEAIATFAKQRTR